MYSLRSRTQLLLQLARNFAKIMPDPQYYTNTRLILSLKTYHQEADEYYPFTSIRNPLDIIVTRYFKRKTNHHGFYTDPRLLRKNGGHVTDKALREYQYILDNQASFQEYFLRFYWLPFDHWGSPSPENFRFIIRFENLQGSFTELLDRMKIRQVRTLPQVNKTAEKDEDFLTVFTPNIQARASWVFGPCSKLWGYSLPSEWKSIIPSNLSQPLFFVLRIIRKNFLHPRLK